MVGPFREVMSDLCHFVFTLPGSKGNAMTSLIVRALGLVLDSYIYLLKFQQNISYWHNYIFVEISHSKTTFLCIGNDV